MPPKQPVRVLYIDNTFTFGGAINSLAHLLGVIDRGAVEPVVVSGHSEDFLRHHFPGCEVHSWDLRVPWVHGSFLHRATGRAVARAPRALARVLGGVRGLAWGLRHDLPDALWLARIGRRHRVDLVHLNNTVESQLSGLLAARLLDVPCVAHARGVQGPTWAARRQASLPARHIAISGFIEENLVDLGVPRERIARIPDGVDLSIFRPGTPAPSLRRGLEIPDGAPIFGIFGRIVQWKGTREFVAAAGRVLQSIPEAFALVVGDVSDGERAYFEEVRELASRLGAGDRIRFTGRRDDVPDLMRLCDVVVHASIDPEPFGMVVAEAMATAKPVVAANLGGPSEIVVPGETGLLVDPRDAAALSGAIETLLKEKEMAQAMGRRGAERARRRYSAERYAEQVLSVYREILPDG